ncbi:MAG: hypothetical protein IPM26_12780 [Saprospiraceae bacterium]|nr:hypothetical protein [Saprospiraceae bacterium]
MKRLYTLTIFLISIISFSDSQASHKARTESPVLQNCTRPKTRYEMKVNNVRAALLTGGDLFDDNIYIFLTDRKKLKYLPYAMQESGPEA